MRCLQAFIIVILLIVGGFLAYIYSGAFNVAATQDNPGWVDWIIRTTREHSIESRVDDVKVPSDVNLDSPQMIALGAKHYAGMCAVCHLAPGEKDSETRAGLNPRPPNLPRIAKYIEPNEAYWIVKNGIRMTAMPAWGPTHSEHDLWAIVAFLKALPGMTPERYKQLSAGGEEMEMNEHGYEHKMAPAPAGNAPLPTPSTMNTPPTTRSH
ncbi:MAG TPA: cytochrome c [Gammaproteobacteria bacterium]|nr:cytochrome c [Gammaproteobacteria bacterium]